MVLLLCGETFETALLLVRTDGRWHGVAFLAQGLINDRSVVNLDGTRFRIDPGQRVFAPVLFNWLLLLALQGFAVVL